MASPIPTLTLAHLRAQGVTLTTGEALAVAQSLFESDGDDARPPFGPLSPENVVVRSDGSVTSKACAATPTVLEAAILLEELLPDGHRHVPGALRYTLGRALHEVAAPPFDSLADFSRALRRFEHGERAALVRRVYVRAMAPPAYVDSLQEGFALPFAAAVLAGLAMIGAGEAMHAGRAPQAAAHAAAGALDAYPIVFNPPPMFPAAREVVFARTAVSARRAVPARAPVRREAATPRSARSESEPGFFSRVLPRIRITFDEL